MTITYYPFDAGAGSSVTEAEWMNMMRGLLSTGVFDLGRSAIDLNKFEVYADSTGMQVKVKSGSAWIEGFFMSSSAEEIVSLNASDPTNDRIDLIILKLDRTANTMSITKLTGTPAGSPVAPTLTQTSTTWEIAIAEVLVGNGVVTITAGSVTDRRVYTYPTEAERRRFVGLIVFQSASQVGTGDGIDGVPIPPELNGYNIIDVVGTVHTKGITGSMTVQVRRRRAGSNVDVLSSLLTFGDQFVASVSGGDGTINATNRGVLTGDLLYTDVDTTHTTSAYGLSMIMVLERP